MSLKIIDHKHETRKRDENNWTVVVRDLSGYFSFDLKSGEWKIPIWERIVTRLLSSLSSDCLSGERCPLG
jgi:hypothetical protein